MTFRFEQPPQELTWYHLPALLAAEEGHLTYDTERYRVHGVSNNAVACCWAGLLAGGDDGMVLTDLGRSMLTEWKTGPQGKAWLAEEAAWDEPEYQDGESTPAPDHETPTHQQPDLFGGDQ